MTPELVRRMSAPVPRYTSYPTAPHFSAKVGPMDFGEGLRSLSPSQALSLYVHIPFCAQLCWYCGCNTKATRNTDTIETYLQHLLTEILMVAAVVPGARPMGHIHWGGGSPNSLSADQIRRLAETLHKSFAIGADTEFAVEIDPRWLDQDQIKAFAEAGVNRASVGVQDFNPQVQSAINRVQSVEMTERAVNGMREAGVKGVNIDLVYGLPHQTEESVANTIEEVIRLAPDRIALFGYAHLPSRAKHQSMIDETTLPGTMERYRQSRRAEHLLIEAGYVTVGLDHFAKPDDALASEEIKRNFQGYTTDKADALIGVGASSISQLPTGYYQNAVPRADYERRVSDTGLATVRGILLSDDDKMRASVIERLMCEFEFSKSSLQSVFGDLAKPVIDKAEELVAADEEGLVERTSDGFRVTVLGQPFVRAIASCFDAYLGKGSSTFSAGV
ncbi:MAG: oxygen-independent coproporphyrinogen III oxidase [Hyphomicrobium sp.]